MSAIIFNSNEVKMFPSQKRSDQYDRKARFPTDTNVANAGMSLTGKQGFVLRGCVVDVNGGNLTLQGSDTFHALWLGGNVFNINRASIALPTQRTADGSLLLMGDVAAFHIKWMNGTNALPSGQIGVVGELNNGAGEAGTYGGLELVAMNPNQMVGAGDFYAPVATWNGTKWMAYETAKHKYEAKDITVRQNEVPTVPSTGATGEQSLEQFLAYNTIIDDGGLEEETGKQLNRLQLKRATHNSIVNSSTVNLLDGQIVIDMDRNYLLRGKNGMPYAYKPFITNEVMGYAMELSPDGETYLANSSPTGQFRLYGASTEVRLDVEQGTPWKIRGGTAEDVVGNNAASNPTITLKISKLILEKGLTVTGAPDFSIVNTAFNRNYNTVAGNIQKDGTASVGSQNLTARADHVHPLNVDDEAPSTQAVGDNAMAGGATTYAKRDHKHGMPGFGSATTADSPGGSGGSANTIARSDHSHPLNVDTTVPSTLGVGETAAVGSANTYARRDHKHAMPGLASATSGTVGSDGFMSIADKWKLSNLITNAVPDTRTVAGKALSNNVTLENFILQLNGTSQSAYNGSAARTINITPSLIGAATAAQGTKADTSVQLSGAQSIGGEKTFTGLLTVGTSSNKITLDPSNNRVTAKEFNVYSDRRFKDNIIPCQVKDISQVEVKEYDLKGGKGRHVGVIAQELREQFPELVCEENDKMKTLSVKESKLVYYLMDEIRRLKAELREKAIIS